MFFTRGVSGLRLFFPFKDERKVSESTTNVKSITRDDL